MALPSMEHLSFEDFREVYEPAEDTFALVDAIELDKDSILRSSPCICLEIGCGSGAVITHLGMLLRSHSMSTLLLATDVNPVAIRTTVRTATHNDVRSIECVQCDLMLPLVAQLEGTVDILLFNPPYVPTDDEEVTIKGIAAAWAGGKRGRRVIDRFLPILPQVLSPIGRCYMVCVDENRPYQVADMAAALGLDCHSVLTRRAYNERYTILRFTRQQETNPA